jgi:ATP-binding cassette subfamily F protein uup
MTLLLNPNFLILDEPTNDLDIYTLQVLEDFLFNFAGCLLLVSHDRYFMDRLVDHLFVFEKGRNISHFNGKYTDFRALKQAEQQQAEKAPVEKTVKVRSEKKAGLSFKEKRELESLEKTLEKMESEKHQLVEKLNSGNLPHEELLTVSQQLETLLAETEAKEMRWLELSEKAE